MQFEPNALPAELAGISQVKLFVTPRTRAEFDAAVQALGGRSAFKKPRRYGVWTRDESTLLYPPADEKNLPAALASLIAG